MKNFETHKKYSEEELELKILEDKDIFFDEYWEKYLDHYYDNLSQFMDVGDEGVLSVEAPSGFYDEYGEKILVDKGLFTTDCWKTFIDVRFSTFGDGGKNFDLDEQAEKMFSRLKLFLSISEDVNVFEINRKYLENLVTELCYTYDKVKFPVEYKEYIDKTVMYGQYNKPYDGCTLDGWFFERGDKEFAWSHKDFDSDKYMLNMSLEEYRLQIRIMNRFKTPQLFFTEANLKRLERRLNMPKYGKGYQRIYIDDIKEACEIFEILCKGEKESIDYMKAEKIKNNEVLVGLYCELFRDTDYLINKKFKEYDDFVQLAHMGNAEPPIVFDENFYRVKEDFWLNYKLERDKVLDYNFLKQFQNSGKVIE